MFTIDPTLRTLRDLKELYVQFNARNTGKPMDARLELDYLIDKYIQCGNPIFYDFANLLIRNHDYIINSFVMVEKHGPGKIYTSKLANGPIESLNRKAKDLKDLVMDTGTLNILEHVSYTQPETILLLLPYPITIQ